MIRYKSTAVLTAAIFLFLAACDKPPRQRASSPKAAAPTIASATPRRQLEKEQMEPLLNELKLKNPFTPVHFVDATPKSVKEIELEGIMWDKERPYAVIDGTVVAEGEFIDGKRVIRINNETVILDNQGREETLRIKLKWE
jgi:type II secretory pathway component PulC